MRYGFASILLALSVAFLSACSHHDQTLPPTVPQSGTSPQSIALEAGKTYQAIPNEFGAARGKALSDADLDTYIDPSVTGADRTLAHTLMGFMPANMRGDFVYLGPGNRLVSNNPRLLKYITLTPVQTAGQQSAPGARSLVAAAGTRVHPMDYSSPCSPPNPPNAPMGAYVRQVSLCGFTAGFGFVNVPCGSSNFPINPNTGVSNDAGYLYMELQGNNAGSRSLTEGGFQYNNDFSIAPWLKPPGGQVTMNNNSARFTCGENLGILHGATQTGQYLFTSVGELPINCTPQQVFCNGNTCSEPRLRNTQFGLPKLAHNGLMMHSFKLNGRPLSE